jgi:5-methylcytosine-specific restriction protein A
MRFEVGKQYNRRQELHDVYGGQRQQGIVTPADSNLIFLITGQSGSAFGYTDGWELEGVFRYFGEGQTGDMTFDRAANRRVRDHAQDGSELHLFEDLDNGMLRYLGEMSLAGWKPEPNVPDGEGNPRTAIVFFLAPLTGTAAEPDELPASDGTPAASDSGLWSLGLDELRDRALAHQQSAVKEPKEATQKVRARSRALRVYVLRRADGTCEGCTKPAPFETALGRPFLETHHIRRLSDGGLDDPAWVAGVCPNCHRRAHHAADAEAFNAVLRERVQAAESNSPAI